MSRRLHKNLEEIQNKLLNLASIVEDVFKKSIITVKTLDQSLIMPIIERDRDIDLKEVEIEEDCLKILATQQPVAIDLRFLVGVLKVNNDLERIGDLAVNIAERAGFILKHPTVKIPFNFDDMTEKAIYMLKQSVTALIEEDVNIARKVCALDDEVDAINRDMYEDVFDAIKSNPDAAESYINYISISRHIERVADYATNIAEDVIYMVTGEIVRHRPETIE